MTVEIFNLTGGKVSSLISGKLLEAGEYNFDIGGLDPGVYMVKMNAGGTPQVLKIISLQTE